MKRVTTLGNTFTLLLVFCCSFSWSIACIQESDCFVPLYNIYEKCCHGTCIAEDATCISGGAIAGIVIGCLIIGGVVLSFCLCFCCACGPFQNRNRGTVIQYGQGAQTATTTTGVTSHSTQYGASYPQPAPTPYPVQGQAQYQTSGLAPYPSAAPGLNPQAGGMQYPPPQVAPPSYTEASKPPPYNPVYPH